MRYPTIAPVLVLSLIAALTGCQEAPTASDQPPADQPAGDAPADLPVVSWTAHDFKYDGPASVPAGMTELQVVNTGREPHQAQLVKVPEDKTVEDVAGALAAEADGEPMPEWAELAGGPNGADPGDTASAFVDLEAGKYIVLCAIPSRDGTIHAAKGMITELVVEESDAAAQSAPSADIELAGKEFAFGVRGPLEAGPHVVKLTNMGEQPHEAFLVRLDEDASATDYLASFSADATGAPPGKLVGGVVGIAPESSQSFPIELEPGRYAFMCAFPDDDTNIPHAALGMYHEFDVP